MVTCCLKNDKNVRMLVVVGGWGITNPKGRSFHTPAGGDKHWGVMTHEYGGWGELTGMKFVEG